MLAGFGGKPAKFERRMANDFIARPVEQEFGPGVEQAVTEIGNSPGVVAHAFEDEEGIKVALDRCPESRLHADRILIATGSYPFRPPNFPFHDPRVYDSNTVLMLHNIPPTMLVVGGGVIGCEYACIFAALGVEVTIVEKRDTLVGFLDDEVAAALRSRMEEAGIRILTQNPKR